jgi:PAS domain S-box-containing protein
VFAVDHEGRITAFNRAAEQISGTPRSAALGRPLTEVIRCDPGTLDDALRSTLETGKPAINQAFYALQQDGHQLPISVSLAELPETPDGRGGAVGAFRDLTGVFEGYLSGGKRDPRGDLRKQLLQQSAFADIISRNREMRKIFAILPEVAQSASAVLIEGQGGAGKELLAGAIHGHSPRSRRPLLVVKCDAMAGTALESELFGHAAGAFTGARRDRRGRIVQASGGTVYLDEIGDLTPAVQVRLLRLLQEGEVEPLGSTRVVQVDTRVIAATRHDLEERVNRGILREDLYYRLGAVRLTLPPLAQRREDIPLLVDHCLARLRTRRGKEVVGIEPDALALLMQHEFPGNVRELEGAIEYAFVLCPEGLIRASQLPPRLLAAVRGESEPRHESLADLEAGYLREALGRQGYNVSATARELGLHRTTLWRRMRRLGIHRPAGG